MEANLLSDDHFSIDGSLLQSHASLKSLKHIEELRRAAEERDDDDGNSGGDSSQPMIRVGNPWVDFRGEKRSNKTHRSTTDPEALLYTKTKGVAYLQHSMHVLMENRHGIGVDIKVGKADGYAERTCALQMLERVERRLGIRPETLAADKGYDAGAFLAELESRDIVPHAACRAKNPIIVRNVSDAASCARQSNQDRTRTEGYTISQRVRKRNEEVFAWLKVVGGLRRSRVCGRWKIQQLADMALSTLNMVRISRLLPT